jgi:hypothetical protein
MIRTDMAHVRSGYNMVKGVKVWSATETVVDQEQFDSGPFNFGASYTDGSLDQVIESLLAIRKLIPEQFRASARCEIDSTSGYEGSHYPHIEVNFVRPETAKETAAREAEERAKIAATEAQERAAFEALKKKFG